MIYLYILFSIILLIIILLQIPLILEVKYENNDIYYKFKILFITIFPKVEKGKKQKKVDELKAQPHELNDKDKAFLKEELAKEKEAYEDLTNKLKSNVSQITENVNDILLDDDGENEDEDIKDDKNKSKFESYKGKWNIIKIYLPMGKKYFKKIIKKIKVTDVEIDITVSDSDAYDCALNYGKMNILVYNILGALSKLFFVKLKRINISCDFDKGKSEYYFSAKIKMRLGSILVIAVSIFINYIYTTYKFKKRIKAEA